MVNYWFVTSRWERARGCDTYESHVQSEHPLVTAARIQDDDTPDCHARIVFYAPLSEEELISSPEAQAILRFAMDENDGELHLPDGHKETDD
jgi:hypothetical protein